MAAKFLYDTLSSQQQAMICTASHSEQINHKRIERRAEYTKARSQKAEVWCKLTASIVLNVLITDLKSTATSSLATTSLKRNCL